MAQRTYFNCVYLQVYSIWLNFFFYSLNEYNILKIAAPVKCSVVFKI